MTVQFGKFETREQVVRRLEQPVREYLMAERKQQSDLVGPEAWTDLHVILAELDRIDRVEAAQRQVNLEVALRAEAASKAVMDSVLPAEGTCSEQIFSPYGGSRDCQHPAKSRLSDGPALCGTHIRRPLENAIKKAINAEPPSEARQIVLDDVTLRATRENWVR